MPAGSESPSASTVDRIFTKIDEQTAMQMRTREDLIEMKGDVRSLKESQVRNDTRQTEFENDVNRRLESHVKETGDQIVSLDDRITEIHEERIAEKAQWRGPEKVIAVLIALGGAISLFAVLKTLFFP